MAGEPFAVLYCDVVMHYDSTPVLKQLIDVYEEFGLGVLAAKEVPKDQIVKYGSLKLESIIDNLFKCSDMVEKPTPEKAPSFYSILGRCILPPEIFGILENTSNGVGGELQLTDAMKALAKDSGMIAVDFVGKRYDMGSKLGILQAAVEEGLRNSETKEEFKKYLLELSKKI